MKKLIFLLSLLLTTSTAFADELILTKKEAREQGYRPKRWGYPMASVYVPYKQNLPWSFENPYNGSPMGNSYNQYQPYELPGYHQGCDMIQESGSRIFSPIDGRLEAGHYGYTLEENGDRVKQWKPWPAQGNSTYFEVAIIDSFGNRFEYHHVNRDSLPQEIVNQLNNNKEPMVKKGQPLGTVINWFTSFQYHHFHVNVYDAQGTTINPESIFQLIPDSRPPQVQFLAVYKNGKTEWVSEGAKISAANIDAFVITGADEKDAHEYVQAPVYVEISQDNKILGSLDFRNRLYDSKNSFLDIRDIYPEVLQLPNGQKLKQMSDFYPLHGVKFNLLLKVNGPTVGQPFTIKVADMAGNITQVTGQF